MRVTIISVAAIGGTRSLSRSVSILGDEGKSNRSATDWDKVLQGRQTQSPSTNRPEKAIPVAAYQSFGRTNLGGRLFPLAWAFTGFAPEREHKTGERLAMYKIEVTNVTVRSMVERRLFDTIFRGAAVVEDYRGHRELPLDYEITNSAPPRLSDDRRLAAARQAWQLELARKRKEVLAKDWTIRAGGRFAASGWACFARQTDVAADGTPLCWGTYSSRSVKTEPSQGQDWADSFGFRL